MPRKPQGPCALTNAERQAAHRVRKVSERVQYRIALHFVSIAKTLEQARAIADAALEERPNEETTQT
jgi:hypothetical protein